ncbi:single-stranded-DNA-specific exonuclease RecJ [Pueribacillus theae]|uniref:Single-stranded-DNA-specific exonuclease RecJ n=1 Tax=Pueribacillus theae TaxID=2171751 RepID=A0A2U1JZU4_9BACI|nr:single-stranded-DNA-specific exonuclease RecJ [Pueribacillus theae]PWA10741.1 single-stranded-DNA-specific exonuclease RecJ [Pueribacillus theae]
MLKAKTKWRLKKASEQAVFDLQSKLSISELTAKLLVTRGIVTEEDARNFLDVDAAQFYDPFLLDGMDKTVARIKQAVENRERILIFGDYDADGVTSTSLLVYTLRKLKADFFTYIPNRFTEGYGPNEAAFRWAKQQGVNLIVTVDTGISAVYEAEVALMLGIDLVITDHHEPPPKLPEAYAIVNPKKPGCSYPFKGLAGVGVAFKVAHALLGELPRDMLDLAAIGTVADLVPMKDENRKIVSEGIKLIGKRKKPGIDALLKVSGIQGNEINEELIGFAIGPRLNAAGRLDSAEPALNLLISEDEEEAQMYAEEIDRLNKERQEIVNVITKQAMELVEKQNQLGRVIVVAGEGWNSGIVGIVASRLVERYYRPAIVLAIEPETGEAKGSARSIPAFDLYANLSECRDILPQFGGHQMAAGLTIATEDIDELSRRLNEKAHQQLTEDDFTPISEIDAVCHIENTTIDTIEEIARLQPFGTDNPAPKFLFENKQLSQLKKIGSKENHLKFQLKENGATLDGIGFHFGHLFNEINQGSAVSVVGELSINEWNGFRKPQLMLLDMSVNEWQLFDLRGKRKIHSELGKLPAENIQLVYFREGTLDVLQLNDWRQHAYNPIKDEGSYEREKPFLFILDLPYDLQHFKDWYETTQPERTYVVFFNTENHFFDSVPSREQFKFYYAFLMKQKTFSLHQAERLAKAKRLSIDSIHFMSKVFSELNFVTIKKDNVSFVTKPLKRDLAESETYTQKLKMIEIEKALLYSSYEELKSFLKKINHCSFTEGAKINGL